MTSKVEIDVDYTGVEERMMASELGVSFGHRSGMSGTIGNFALLYGGPKPAERLAFIEIASGRRTIYDNLVPGLQHAVDSVRHPFYPTRNS
jgi:hypothetical protein